MTGGAAIGTDSSIHTGRTVSAGGWRTGTRAPLSVAIGSRVTMAAMLVGPVARLLRAAVFTAACVMLSAAGHVLMSQQPVPVWAVMAAPVVVFPLAWVLAARRCGYARIAALMLGCELALHEVFATAQRLALASVATPTHITVTVCGGGHMVVPVRGSASTDVMSGSGAMGHGPWEMAAVHAAAGLLCAWWLWQGETAVFALLWAMAVSLFGPLLIIIGQRLVPRWRAPACRTRELVRSLRQALLSHTVVRRGPPVCCA